MACRVVAVRRVACPGKVGFKRQLRIQQEKSDAARKQEEEVRGDINEIKPELRV